MIMKSSPKSESSFVRDGLPWVIGAAALLVYLATLNHWVTLNSLPVAAKVNGWDWQPMLFQPVLFALTYPCRWLPPSWVPLALNLFTAVCASLTLALLARSVALLPHNRLHQQRLLLRDKHALLSLPDAWVPPVLATVGLGLQLTFWENATAASGEMLDLLLFAYLTRCLLEHRMDERQSWLDQAAGVCGVAVANSWAMVGLLPLFLVALLWIKRLQFFNLRFLRRMALFGLAGLSLFLVLPLVQAFSPDSPVGFWQALRTTAGAYKTNNLGCGTVFLRNRDVALVLAAVSLLPVLVLSIRWSTLKFADSPTSRALQSFTFYICHAFLLLICIGLVFDPPFSPRQVSRHIGLPLLFLPLYFLSALSIGYYSGFFLLVFGADALKHIKRQYTIRGIVCWAVPKLVYVLFGLVLAGLPLKNFPAIQTTNGVQLGRYARWAAGSLPPEGAVVLSDDPTRLALIQASLAREGKAGRYLPVGTRALPLPAYRAWLGRRYPERWPEPKAEANPALPGVAAFEINAPLDDAGCLQLLMDLAQSNRLYYLQPSFGSWLEQFYFQPHGLVYELKLYPTNSLGGPPLTAAELAENEVFWKRTIEKGVDPILRVIAQAERPRPGLAQRLMKSGHLQMPPPAPAEVLAVWYSAAINSWGTTLQRNGRWHEATPCFALAQQLNPGNLPAQVNLQCNRNLLAGQKMTVVRSKPLGDQFGKYRNWNQILAENGTFDEPNYYYHLGLFYGEGGLLRLAGQQLERVKALAPGDISMRLALGDLFNRCRLSDQALQIAAEIRADPDLQPLGPTNEVEVTFLEAGAWLARTNHPEAERIIDSLLAAHPGDAALLGRAGAAFAAHRSYANALRLADRQLQLTPDDPFALLNKGSLCILARDYSNAIPPLTRTLSLTNTYPARLNRALAYFRMGRLDAAEADYQELLRAFPADYQPYQGLAEIAREKSETNAAIRYYQLFLSKAAANSEEARIVATRLKTLQQGLP